MRKIIIAALIITALIVPMGVSAQSQVSVDLLQISFWSEYDRPDVLVLYNIELSENTIFPAELSFRIPAEVGQPNAVAELVGGRLVNAEFSMDNDGEWLNINITATSPTIHLEYYDPGLEKTGITRSFEYQWLGDQAIELLQYKVQQPFGSTNLELSLPAGGPIDQDGLNYYIADLGRAGFGESNTFSFSYDKTSDDLTVQSAVQEETQSDEAIPLSEQINFQWVLAIAAIALIGFGVYNSLRTNKPKRRPARRQKAKTTRVKTKRKKANNLFCHNCGAPGDNQDKFCRECGEKLRK